MTPQSTMTTTEAERLREILAQHDQVNGGKKNNEFDLANPPRVISSGGAAQNEQYRHQEYPLHMTKPLQGKPDLTKIAKSPEEAEKLARKGYLGPADYRAHVASLTPEEADEEENEDDDLDEAEVRAQIDAASGEFDPNAPAPKKKAGRPKKEA